MAALQEPRVFRFCAIPQVMAIATLAECYANPEVFKRVVKIPKTTSARIMVGTGSIRDVALAFRVYARKLALKARARAAMQPCRPRGSAAEPGVARRGYRWTRPIRTPLPRARWRSASTAPAWCARGRGRPRPRCPR